MITQDDIVRVLSQTVAHEVGHALGLLHLKYPSPGYFMEEFGAPDSGRVNQSFGNQAVQLAPDRFERFGKPGDLENSGARLALSVGSDEDVATLKRDPAIKSVFPNPDRTASRVALSLGVEPIRVVRAAIGVVPLGQDDIMPVFYDLGAGDLATLLSQNIDIGLGDKVIVIASTTGNGIDIFGVAQDFAGDVRDVDLGNGLAAVSDPKIRGDLFDAAGQPVLAALSLYQQTAAGPVQIGTVGASVNNPTPVDVTNQVRITRGGFRFDRATSRFVQPVTLTNTGGNAIAGPVSLVLDRLGTGTALTNAIGVTAAVAPLGSPYLNVGVGGLGAGQSATLRLQFTNPGNAGISYTTRVLAGPGTR